MILKRVVWVALFTALAVVLSLPIFSFSIPVIFPDFLKIKLTMLPIIMSFFILGYKESVLVVFIYFLFSLISTSTMYVGEAADLLIYLSVVSSMFLVKKFLKKDLYVFLAIIISWTLVATLANLTFLLRAYIYFYCKNDVNVLLQWLKVVYKNINQQNMYFYYIVCGIIPFNIMLSGVISLISFILHNRLRNYYVKIN